MPRSEINAQLLNPLVALKADVRSHFAPVLIKTANTGLLELGAAAHNKVIPIEVADRQVLRHVKVNAQCVELAVRQPLFAADEVFCSGPLRRVRASDIKNKSRTVVVRLEASGDESLNPAVGFGI